MVKSVTGNVGLPDISIASFQKDRTGRTKSSHLFSGAKAKGSPLPKTMDNGPKVRTEALVKAAKLSSPQTTAPTGTGKTVSNGTQPTGAQPTGTQPTGKQPLSQEATTLLSKLPKDLDVLQGKIESFAETAHELSGSKGKGLEDNIGTRQTLLKEVQSKLADLEKKAADHLDKKEVDTLRMRLVGMAIDLAMPEIAYARSEDVELGEEARQLVQLGVLKDKGGKDKAPDLHAEHRALARQLTDLRTAFAGKPEAELVTGAFLKAFSETTVGRDTKLDPGSKLQVFQELAQALSKGDISVGSMPLLRTDDPGVGKLLQSFRAEHYAGDAARNFVLKLDPVQEKQALDSLRNLDTQKGGSGELKMLDAAAIRKALPQHLHAEFDKAVSGGRAAAKLRDEFEDQRTRTARALGSGNAHLAESSVLLRVKGARVLDKSGALVEEKSTNVDAALKKLAKTNKEGAFQVARLAIMMEKLADAEDKALGRNQFGLKATERCNSDAILQITGVTAKDIEAMGYSLDEVGGTFKDNMERLGKAGFEDVGQVKDAMTRMRGGKAVLENRGVQANLHADLMQQTAATGKLLQVEISSDAVTTIGAKLGKDLSEDPAVALKQAMTGIATSVQDALFVGDDGNASGISQKLNDLQTDILGYDQDLGKLAKSLTSIEQEMSVQQKVLLDYDGKNGRIDAQHPSGLDSAKLILKVLDFDDVILTLPNGKDKDQLTQERDKALAELKGFDTKALKRTWTGKSPFSSAQPPSITTIRGLRDQAEAIVYLRETGPKEMDEVREAMTNVGIARDKLVAERREVAPRLFLAVDRMVHLATAMHIPYDKAPDTVKDAFDPKYDMSASKDKIINQLKEWGLDTTAFAVEIDTALSTPITGKTLDTWRAEASRGTFDDLMETGFIDKDTKPFKSKFADLAKAGVMLIANKSQITSQMRMELEALVDTLPKNSKFDLSSGTEISLNSGRIPVEPTATVTVRGRLSGSVFKSMVIETGGNGEIKLTGMLGGTVKGGVDVQAALDPLKFITDNPVQALGGKVEVKVGAELSLDGGYEGAGGFQITFPSTPEGKKAAIEALMRLTEQQKPSAEIFEQATDVASFQRHKGDGGLKSQLFAMGGVFWQPGGNDGDMFSDVGGDNSNYKSGASNKHGFGGIAQVEGRAGIGGKQEITRSLDKVTVKTETSSFVSVGGKIALYAQTFSALGMGSNAALTGSGGQQGMDQQFDKDSSGTKTEGTWNGGSATVPYELVNLGVEVRVTTTNKKKLEFGVVGSEGREMLQKAEMKELTDGINTKTIHHLMASFSDGTLDAIKQDKTKIAQVKDMLNEISRSGLSSSQIEVTYNIKPEKLAIANEMFREAELAEESGDTRTARNLMATAKGIIDDRENYTPVKLSLIDKTSAKDVANRGMAILGRVDITSTVGTERVVMSISLEPPKT